MKLKTTAQITAMINNFLDYLVSFKHNFKYVLRVDALDVIGVSGFHCLRPLSRYI